MEEKEFVEIVDSEGNKTKVEIVTYLTSNDKLKNYVVYTKGEFRGENNGRVIYISKIYKNGDDLKIEEITSDSEWLEVQQLLKRIANVD